MAVSEPETRRSKLQRRLRHLRNWEALNIVLMPTLATWVWINGASPVAWSARLPALTLVSFILAQGTLYWHLKLRSVQRSVQRSVPLSRSFCRRFRLLRASALLGFLIATLGAAATHIAGDSRVLDLVWACAVLSFAGLEYVNYYHWQLKHDSAADWAYLLRYRRLRRAPLAVDLTRACRRPRSVG